MQQFIFELRIALSVSILIFLTLFLTVSGFFQDKLIFRLGYAPKDLQLHGRLWQIITYPYVHLNLVVMGVNLFFLWIFGFTLESHFIYMTHFWGHFYFLFFYIIGTVVCQIPTYFTRLNTPKFQVIGAETPISAVVTGAMLMDLSAKSQFYILGEGIPLFFFALVYYVYCFFISRYYNKVKADFGWAFGIIYAVVYVSIFYWVKIEEIITWFNN